jgi:ketosteroid isomerase-like protein
MYKLIAAVCVVYLLNACVFSTNREQMHSNVKHEEALDEMVSADRAFSDSSATLGMKKAFLKFVADDAVLLRPGYLPIVQGDVVKFLTSQEDTSFVMTWAPKGGQLAKSNDLGYTYGTYEIKLKATDSVLTGTYLSIWQKQKNGDWKFVLDTGNAGATEEVQ